jgi:diguanylate cyclase (GGDEF)-like protein
MSRRPGQILKGSVDHLTGLPSPHAFDQAVGVELEEAYEANQPVAATFIDIDRLRQTNDQHGLDAGHAVVCGVANELAALAERTASVVGRVGGDEFLVVNRGVRKDEARRQAEQIRADLSSRRYTAADWSPPTGVTSFSGMVDNVTVSVGVVVAQNCRVWDAQRVIDAAEAAREASGEGGDRIVERSVECSEESADLE